MTATLVLAVVLVSSPPKAVPNVDVPEHAVTSSAPSTERQAALQGTLARRKAMKDKKKNAAAQKAARDAEQAKALADWEAYVGPIVAARERADFMLQLEAQRVQALRSMANAAQQEVALERQRLWFQFQMYGQNPYFYQGQGFFPGQGFTPTPATAPPTEHHKEMHKQAHK